MDTTTQSNPSGGALVVNDPNKQPTQEYLQSLNALTPEQKATGLTSVLDELKKRNTPTVYSNVTKQQESGANQAELDKLTTKEVKPETPVTPPVTKPEAPNTYTDYSGNQVPTDGTIPAGSKPDGKGNYIAPDGTQYKAPSIDTSYNDKQLNDLADQVKTNTDTMTSEAISEIQRTYSNLITQQKQINAGQEAGTRSALLMGGVTGQGSSSQYAPISSEGITASQTTYGLQQISNLQAQEMAAIQAAKLADYSTAGGNKALSEKIAEIKDIRVEKVKLANEINKKLVEENQKLAEKAQQSTRDNAIAYLYSQGVTDVTSMLNYLNYDEKGNRIGDYTAEEISSSLKNIVPSGLEDLVTTMRNNGAPEDVIKKVMSSRDMSEAYQNAGVYSAGGTGQIGDYNFYVANVTKAGKTPLNFEDWKKEQENIKNIGTKTVGTSGTPVTNNSQIQGLDDNINQINSLLYKDSKDGKSVENPGLKKSAQLGINRGFITGGQNELQSVQSSADKDIVDFISSVEQIVSQGTLKTLIDAKSKGATFGALSDKELGILASSFSKIGTWTVVKNGRVIGYNVDADTMKKELLKIQQSSTRLKNTLQEQGGNVSTSTDIPTADDYADKISEWAISSPENRSKYKEIKDLFPNATSKETAEQLGINLNDTKSTIYAENSSNDQTESANQRKAEQEKKWQEQLGISVEY